MTPKEQTRYIYETCPPFDIDPQHYDPDVIPAMNELIEQATKNIMVLRSKVIHGLSPRHSKNVIERMERTTSIWLTSKDNDPWICTMCGDPDDVWDHCHDTGLVRGRLCRSCNSCEGSSGDMPHWQLWKWSAPMLQICNKQRQIYNGRRAPTEHERLFYGENAIERETLPIKELFQKIDDALNIRYPFSHTSITQVMHTDYWHFNYER